MAVEYAAAARITRAASPGWSLSDTVKDAIKQACQTLGVRFRITHAGGLKATVNFSGYEVLAEIGRDRYAKCKMPDRAR